MMKVKHTANRLLSLFLVLALAAGFMCIPGLAVSEEPEVSVEEGYDAETVSDTEDGGEDYDGGTITDREDDEEEGTTEGIPETEPAEPSPADTAPSDPQSLSAEFLAEDEAVAGGTFKSGTAWWDIYELADGTYELYVSGEGAMDDYSSNSDQPWYKNYQKYISSVYVDDGITKIGKNAFASLSALVDVYIGAGVTEIGERAFMSCSALGSIEIPYGVETIGDYAFSNAAFTELDLPESLTSIGERAFNSCTKLETVTLPSFLTSIGTYAFYNCTSLTSITFPELVTTIPQRVCSDCTSLESVTFLGDVVEIGNQAFYGCTVLTDITIPDTVETIGSSVFQTCSYLQSIDIPDSVTSLGNNCFNSCTNLTYVTLGSSLEAIGSSTFYGCICLKEITIPASVTSIASNAFYNCTSMKSVTFEGEAPSINSNSFNKVTATCYYHPGSTWTSSVKSNYGGTLTWVAFTDDVIDITVSVDREDGDSASDPRPEELTIVLYADGEGTETAVLSDGNDWTYVFEEMQEYNSDGDLITYSVSVQFVYGYAYSEGDISYDENGNMLIEIQESADPNSTSVPFEILWDDDNDRDGLRPEESVTVTIFADDDEYGTLTVSPDADGNWAGTFEDVPKYTEDGSSIQYTFAVDADGYTCSYSGDDGVITAAHEPYMVLVNNGTGVLNVSLEGEDDAPGSVTVVLYADGDVLDTLTLSEGNGWSGAFTDLYQYENGEQIEYTLTVQEQDEYLFSVTRDTDGDGCVSVTVTYVLNRISIEVTVVFVDDGNRDGLRPSTEAYAVEIALTGNGKNYYGEVGPDEDWTYTFTVPLYDDNGNEIQYVLTCTTLGGYDCEIDGYTIIFTHNPVTYDITVEKVWDDNDDEAGIRPGSVSVTLYGNDEEVAVGEVTAEDDWVYVFSDMPADEDGENIVYSLEENYENDHYYERTQTVVGDDEKVDGVVYDPYSFIITNTYTAEPTHDFTIYKYATDDDGSEIALAGAEFTLQETGTGDTAWFICDDASGSYRFSGWESDDGLTDTLVSGEDGCIAVRSLPEGSYDLTETAAPEGYELPEEPVSLTVDEDTEDSVVYVENFLPEPPEIGFYIYKYSDDGGINGAEFDVEAMDGAYAWFHVEDGVYTFAGWNLDEDEDLDNEDGAYVEFIATANNVGTDGLVYITGLEPGNYYVNEFIPPEGYIGLSDELLITLNEDGTLYYKFASSSEASHLAPDDVIEAYNSPKKDVTVTVVWDDGDNRDGSRPSSLSVTILADGADERTVRLNSGNSWTVTSQLAAKTDNGESTIEYTISVGNVDGYEFTVSPDEDADGNITWTVTASHTPEPETLDITVSIVWDDSDNLDGIRPGSLTVTVLANGSAVDTLVLSEDNSWTDALEDLAKTDENGDEIAYTVTVEDVDGYEFTKDSDEDADGNITWTVTGSHMPEPELLDITVSVVWDDSDDLDGIRPGSLTVTVLANDSAVDTLVLNEGNSWADTLKDLAATDENGDTIEYTISVEDVDGYEFTADSEEDADGNIAWTVTGSHTPEPEVLDITVSVVWDDSDDLDAIRPGTLTVTVLANDSAVDTLVLNEGNSWTDTLEDLAKTDENGDEIVYSVSAEDVDGYEFTADSEEDADGNIAWTITGSHTPEPEVLDITVTVVWDDGDNQDGSRPYSLTVTVLADGSGAETLVLSEDNAWSAVLEDLAATDENGDEIAYTVTVEDVDGYAFTADSKKDAGGNIAWIITGTHTPEPETLDITVSVVWDDSDDQDGSRPYSLTVTVLANDSEAETLVLSEDNAWSAVLEDLAATDENGDTIVYSVSAEDVDGYEFTATSEEDADGNITWTVTGTHTPEPEVLDITISVVWDDSDDQDGSRPYSLTVTVLANDSEVETLVLSEDNAWSAALEDLAATDENGDTIEYTINVEDVDGYEFTTGSEEDNNGNIAWTITGTHTPEPEVSGITVTVSVVWDDSDDQDGIRPDSITVTILANGSAVDTLILTEENAWTASLDNMAATDENGDEISYTVSVETEDGYAFTAGSEEDADGNITWTVTGTHTPEGSEEPGTSDDPGGSGEPGVTPTPEPDTGGEETEPSVTVTVEEDGSVTISVTGLVDIQQLVINDTVLTLGEDYTAEFTEAGGSGEGTWTITVFSETIASVAESGTLEITVTGGNADGETVDITGTADYEEDTDSGESAEPEASVTVTTEEDGSVTISVTGLVTVRQLVINDTALTLGEDYTAEYAEDDGSGEGTWTITVFPETIAAMGGSGTLEITVTGGNADGETVDVTCTIEAPEPYHLPGDVNGDGVVNITDVQALLKYVNKQDVFVIYEALDINADGTINISDVQTLLKYVNGQDVEIH